MYAFESRRRWLLRTVAVASMASACRTAMHAFQSRSRWLRPVAMTAAVASKASACLASSKAQGALPAKLSSSDASLSSTSTQATSCRWSTHLQPACLLLWQPACLLLWYAMCVFFAANGSLSMADGALTDRRNGLVIRGAGWLSAARAKTEDERVVLSY